MTTLKAAEEFLLDQVRPNAERVDQELEALVEVLGKMASAGILGLRVPPEFGGSGLDAQEFRRFQETCARCSGALAFLQTQHQSGCNFLSQSPNEPLKRSLLPQLACGYHKVGIAFSQLRRKGAPILTAEPADGGYVISGTAPWVTGWHIFDKCITAAALPSGESLWFVHSLVESPQLKPGSVMRLASMEVVQTVAVQFDRLFVSSEQVLYTRPAGWIHDSDQINLALQSPFALGCAQAAIDVLEKIAAEKKIEAAAHAANRLGDELKSVRAEAYAAMEDRENANRSLNARASAIELMGRCAHAAVIASSGAGNSMSHPAQRIFREAIVFSVSAQTEPIMSASLEKLCEKGSVSTSVSSATQS